jgi:hypothetical protein
MCHLTPACQTGSEAPMVAPADLETSQVLIANLIKKIRVNLKHSTAHSHRTCVLQRKRVKQLIESTIVAQVIIILIIQILL